MAMNRLPDRRASPLLLFCASCLLLLVCFTSYLLIACQNGACIWEPTFIPNRHILPCTDQDANLVRLLSKSTSRLPDLRQDPRGWLLNPTDAAARVGIQGGATSCTAVHIGQIRPGLMRANHRHHYCNETFIIWGAKTLYRIENKKMEQGYAETVIQPEEVVVAVSPAGVGHALVNTDLLRVSYFVACQDGIFDAQNPKTDYKIWSDL